MYFLLENLSDEKIVWDVIQKKKTIVGKIIRVLKRVFAEIDCEIICFKTIPYFVGLHFCCRTG